MRSFDIMKVMKHTTKMKMRAIRWRGSLCSLSIHRNLLNHCFARMIPLNDMQDAKSRRCLVSVNRSPICVSW